MKHRLLAFLLLFSGLVWSAPPAKQAEYNVNVHVNASRTVKHSEAGPRYQYVDVTIDGQEMRTRISAGCSRTIDAKGL